MSQQSEDDGRRFGLYEFLTSDWTKYEGRASDPVEQVRKGIEYIARRYGRGQAGW